MRTEEKARFGRVLADAFDLGERIVALAGIVSLDDVLVDVDAIVREREAILEREG